MTLRHLAQREDVLPRCPDVLLYRLAPLQRRHDVDLTDEPPHELDGAVGGGDEKQSRY